MTNQADSDQVSERVEPEIASASAAEPAGPSGEQFTPAQPTPIAVVPPERSGATIDRFRKSGGKLLQRGMDFAEQRGVPTDSIRETATRGQQHLERGYTGLKAKADERGITKENAQQRIDLVRQRTEPQRQRAQELVQEKTEQIRERAEPRLHDARASLQQKTAALKERTGDSDHPFRASIVATRARIASNLQRTPLRARIERIKRSGRSLVIPDAAKSEFQHRLLAFLIDFTLLCAVVSTLGVYIVRSIVRDYERKFDKVTDNNLTMGDISNGLDLLSLLSPTTWERMLTEVGAILFVSFIGLSLVYFTSLEGLVGRTFGKWVCGLRVARGEDGRRPGLRKALARNGVRAVEFAYLPLLVVGLPIMAFSPMRQRPADWLCHTMVIRTRRLPANPAPALASGSNALVASSPAPFSPATAVVSSLETTAPHEAITPFDGEMPRT